ncbi:MAG TPA: hypothetical protein DHU55_15125 [Blastocatellia bacterium]|jgi:hypothetical protein|nr:hypothetical protein [Blastocatellia bacterium]
MKCLFHIVQANAHAFAHRLHPTNKFSSLFQTPCAKSPNSKSYGGGVPKRRVGTVIAQVLTDARRNLVVTLSGIITERRRAIEGGCNGYVLESERSNAAGKNIQIKTASFEVAPVENAEDGTENKNY